MENVYKKVLVCIDGSKGSDRALRDAVDVVKYSESHLDILRVLDINTLEYAGAGLSLNADHIMEIEAANKEYMLDIRKKVIEEYGLEADQVDVHLRFGNPKVIIVEEFQPEHQNDLIVIGSTGKNFVERVVVGSVASHIIKVANCDVLVSKKTDKE